MKILMVDDHALFRDGLRLLLSSIRPDAILFEADTVADALSVLQEHPDLTLCLLDLNLRQERGLPVLKKIRFEVPEVSVIVVSGSDDPSTVRACREAGAMSYIPKGLTSEKFLEAMNWVLDGKVFFPHEANDAPPSSNIPKLTPANVKSCTHSVAVFPRNESPGNCRSPNTRSRIISRISSGSSG